MTIIEFNFNFNFDFDRAPELLDDYLRDQLTEVENRQRNLALRRFDEFAAANPDRKLYQILYRPSGQHDSFNVEHRRALIAAAKQFVHENGLKEKGFVGLEAGELTGVFAVYVTTLDHALWSFAPTIGDFEREHEIAEVSIARVAREYLLFWMDPE